MDVIQYLPIINSYSNGVFIRKEMGFSDFWSVYLIQYDWKIWICVFIQSIFACLFFAFVAIKNKAKAVKFIVSIENLFLNVSTAFGNNPYKNQEISIASEKIVVLTICLSGNVLFMAYQGRVTRLCDLSPDYCENSTRSGDKHY